MPKKTTTKKASNMKTSDTSLPLYLNLSGYSANDKREWLRLCGIKANAKADESTLDLQVQQTIELIRKKLPNAKEIDGVAISKGLWGVQTGRINPDKMTVVELKNWLKTQSVDLSGKMNLRKQEYVDMVLQHSQ